MGPQFQEVQDDDILAAFDTGQDHDYEDELGTQIPINMGLAEDEDNENMTIDKGDHISDPHARRNSMENKSLKQTPDAMIIRLRDDEDVVDVEEYSSNTEDLRKVIKNEYENSASSGTTAEVIKLEDDDSDVQIIWPDLENHVIDITDSGDEQDVIDVDEDLSINIKTEATDVGFQWDEMVKGTIDLIDIPDSDVEEEAMATSPTQRIPDHSVTVGLGRSVLQNMSSGLPRQRMDMSRLQEAQRIYADRHRQDPVVTGAGSIFRGLLYERDPASGLDFDGDDAERFRAMKKKYKAQMKAGKNTEEDDILFMAAEKKEKARAKKVMDAYLRASGLAGSDNDEDEAAADDDERTFAPRFTRSASTSKRPHASTDAESDDAASGDENDPPAGKRPRSNQTDRRAYLKEFKVEEYWNMMSGCEKMIYDEKKKEEKEAKKAEKDLAKSRKNGKKHKAKKPVLAAKAGQIKKSSATKKQKARPKVPKPNPNRTNYLNQLGGLMPGNVYDDANANLAKRQLATTNTTKKMEALAGLLAGIDNDDLPSAQREKNRLDRSMKILGKRRVKPDGEGKWKFKGMICSLHHYQVQGSGFMKEREIGDLQPKGGLLCDAMGLGKTVMAIAAMVANRPASGSETKCTLIVVTPALATQWISELEKHVEPGIFPEIVRHSASTRIAGPGALQILQTADVVLTTYQELVRSYPRCEPPPELTKLEEKKQWWRSEWDLHRGPLHRVFFHRVILDEAQFIKNHTSLTSIACRAVMARHRWALTGTPIQNRVSEIYPFFRYLRVKHSGSFDVFKQNYCVQNDKNCTERLHAYLRQFMIRRTHKSEFMGAPLLTLPENSQRTVTVEFTELERTLYKAVRDKFVRNINAIAKHGQLEARSSYILTMCLRLRQLTAHPFLIQDVIQDLFSLEDIEKLWALSGPEVIPGNKRGKELYTAMKNMIESKEPAIEDNHAATEELPSPGTENPTSQNELGLALRFRKYLRSLNSSRQWIALKERSLCNKCNAPPDEPWVTSCFHLYCKECLNNMAYETMKNHGSQTLCLECGEPFTESQPCNGIEELEMVDVPTQGRSVAKDRQRRKPYQKDAVRWLNLEGDVLQSSKTLAVKIQLEAWLTAEPDKKIVVFSQFLLLMKVVARICEQNGWGYCSYNGSMSHEARDESLTTFRDEPDKQILIASLKCGGVGLNLTMASKVICIDLWWNSCVEQQAFCRVFRIGQDSETHITRFVVKDTIDENLVSMQKEKEEAIGKAIDDNNQMLKQLPTHDLMRLFGSVSEDEEGRPFILVDDDELGTIEPPAEKPAKPKKPAKGAKKGKKPGRPKSSEKKQTNQPTVDSADESEGFFVQ